MPGNEFTDDFNESTSPVHQFSPVIVDHRENRPCSETSGTPAPIVLTLLLD